MIKIIYHKDCYDGFCAAWVAQHVLEGDKLLIPALYGDQPPHIEEGDEVYILDFSYPRDTLIQMSKAAKKLIVLDHHKTAQANCEGLDFCIFDMNRSGAALTWNYFYPQITENSLVAYVEDRDLWLFNLPNSRSVNAWIASFPMDFDTWNTLSDALQNSPEDCLREGRAIRRYHHAKVVEVCNQSRMTELAGYSIPVVNCPYHLGSDCGHELLERYPDAPFSAYYLDRGDGEQQWGLRGRSTDNFDVSMIAQQFGGGGHKKAAGFLKGKVSR